MSKFLEECWLGSAMTKIDEILRSASLPRHTLGIHNAVFPDICVVGDANSGKSRLIEQIIGKHVLPIHSRSPIRVCLRYREADNGGPHILPTMRVRNIETSDESKIHTELQKPVALTLGLTQEIVLVVYDSHFPNIDIIDIPGLIVVERRNERVGLPETIKSCAKQYLANPSNIVIAVMSADTLESQSPTVGLLKEMYREFIKVLTKPDLVDILSFDSDILAPTHVVCVNTNETDEEEFFKQKMGFEQFYMCRSKLGMKSLFKVLSDKTETSYDAWKKIEIIYFHAVLKGYKDELSTLGPSLTSEQIAAILTQELFANDRILLEIGEEAWRVTDETLPGPGICDPCNPVPISGFLACFEAGLVSQFQTSFDSPALRISRYEKFKKQLIDGLHLKFQDNRNDVFARWDELHHHLMIVRDLGTINVAWQRAAICCVVQKVIFRLDEKPRTITGYEPKRDTLTTHMQRFLSQFSCDEDTIQTAQRRVLATKIAAITSIFIFFSHTIH